MENSGGIQASLSGRYATALFDLARESKAIDQVGKNLAGLEKAIASSQDFSGLIANPLVSRQTATKTVTAVAKAMKLDKITGNFLGVLAENRRLDQLSAIIGSYNALASAHRGEANATVTSAHKLDSTQVASLKEQLKAKVGRDVAIEQKVDPEILGGLIVRIGSQMIDSSIRTRLNTLATAMKG